MVMVRERPACNLFLVLHASAERELTTGSDLSKLSDCWRCIRVISCSAGAGMAGASTASDGYSP